MFPQDLDNLVKVSITDYSLDSGGHLTFHNWIWVPNHEPLWMKIVQLSHDSLLSIHPGRQGTVTLIARAFFWPNFMAFVQQFIWNCDVCRRSMEWRDQKQGMLCPLPILEHQWREISIDFIGPLPTS